ncbi:MULTISPECIES: serine/threonine-protein kinase [Streptomyces]|uniref:serine/threonine-protein kinase n=1 Tax=Streptomyces TaxID=1883 RepID=UPI00278C6DF7|nr:serine/threonine-protein kinase [Streptomyces hydrogenans]
MRPHDVVDQRYELLALLGSGGFGEVWRAFDRRVGRPVAVKIGLHRSAEERRRFAAEARLAGNLQHPCVVALYDYGEVHHEGAALMYLVMELVEGETLAAILRRGVPPLETALRWARDICRALAAAHDAHIVHRDVKPANVIITGPGGGRAKVLDFGIARREDETGITATGMVIGSAPYMAPERWTGDAAVDGRADLYALGCVLMELLTGQHPFPTPHAHELLAAHALTVPPVPSSLRPGIGPAADRLVADLLAKDPGHRPADAHATVARLDALIREAARGDAVRDPDPDPAPTRRVDSDRGVRDRLAARLRESLGADPDPGGGFLRRLDRLVADVEDALGADDPLTVEAAYQRAMYLFQQAGDRGELESLLPRLLRVLGPDHRRTIDVEAAVTGSAAARGSGDGRQLIPGLREVVERATRVLGPGDPITLLARLDLAEALDREYDGDGRPLTGARERTPERSARRRDQLAPLLPDLERGLGAGHPRVWEVTLRLARDTYALGGYGEALAYYERLLPTTPALLNRTDMGLRIQHAHCVAETGDPERAVALLDSVLAALYSRGDALSARYDAMARKLRSDAKKAVRRRKAGRPSRFSR